MARPKSLHCAIVIPKPIDEVTTPCVLTMDFVCGTKVSAITPLTCAPIHGEELEVEHLFIEVSHAASARGVKPPSDLAMLGKTLLNLDHVARTLAPRLDVNATIREQAMTLMRERMAKSTSAGSMLTTVLGAKHFAERLPVRVSRVLDVVASNDLRLKVEVNDEGAVIDGLQKVANRIALGLVLAALIVAAALIMLVPTSFRLFGYPGLAMILFILAATGGAMLALQTHDRTVRSRQ